MSTKIYLSTENSAPVKLSWDISLKVYIPALFSTYGFILVEEICRSLYYMSKVASIKGKTVRQEFPSEFDNLIGLLIINMIVYGGYATTGYYQ